MILNGFLATIGVFLGLVFIALLLVMVKKIFKKSPIYDKDKLLLALDVYLSELYAVEDYLEIGRIMELKKEILDDNQKNVHSTINVKQSTNISVGDGGAINLNKIYIITYKEPHNGKTKHRLSKDTPSNK